MSLITETRQLIDEAGAGTFWTDAHLYDALNGAIVEVASHLGKWGLYEVSVDLTVDSGMIEIPATVMVPLAIVDNEGMECFLTDQRELEEEDQGWRSAVGRPRWFTIWDAGHLRVWPSPDQTYTYTLRGIGWPEEIDGTVTDVGDPLLRNVLARMAAATLLEFTQPTVADVYADEAAGQLAQYRKRLRNPSGHRLDRLHPMPGRYLHAQTGVISLGRGY